MGFYFLWWTMATAASFIAVATAQKDAGRTGDVREDRRELAMLLMRLLEIQG